MEQALKQLLDASPLFAGFEQSELAEVLSIARQFEAEAGTTLMQQGEIADGMYLLHSGSVRVSACVPGDEIVELGTRSTGALIGEVSMLDLGTRSATVVALTRLNGFFFDAQRFNLLRSDLHRGAFHLLEHLYCGIACNIRQLITQIASAPLPAATRRTPAPTGVSSQLVRTTVDHQLLKQLPLFEHFSDQELNEFVALTDCLQGPRDTPVFRQGDRPDALYIVVRGALRLSVERHQHHEQLAIKGPGKLAGTLALIVDQAHCGSCEIRENATLLRLPLQAFALIRQGQTAMAHKFMEAVNHALAEQLRVSSRHVARLVAQGQLQGNKN